MEELFSFIKSHAEWAEDASTEKWIQAHIDAVEAYNDQQNTLNHKYDYDFFNIMFEYAAWHNKGE